MPRRTHGRSTRNNFPRNLGRTAYWRSQYRIGMAAKDFGAAFAAAVEVAKATDWRESHAVTDAAKKHCLSLRENKQFKRESQIEEFVGKMLETKAKKIKDTEITRKLSVFIAKWFKEAADSAKLAGDIQRSTELMKRAEKFS